LVMRDEVPKNQEPVIVAVRLDHIQKSQGSHPNLRLSPRPVMALGIGLALRRLSNLTAVVTFLRM